MSHHASNVASERKSETNISRSRATSYKFAEVPMKLWIRSCSSLWSHITVKVMKVGMLKTENLRRWHNVWYVLIYLVFFICLLTETINFHVNLLTRNGDVRKEWVEAIYQRSASKDSSTAFRGFPLCWSSCVNTVCVYIYIISIIKIWAQKMVDF
jgi:hypothetical protein